jgi:hypothetical protein
VAYLKGVLTLYVCCHLFSVLIPEMPKHRYIPEQINLKLVPSDCQVWHGLHVVLGIMMSFTELTYLSYFYVRTVHLVYSFVFQPTIYILLPPGGYSIAVKYIVSCFI